MKRLSRPLLILINILLVVLVVCLLYANFASQQRDVYNARLVQWAYQGDENRYGKSLQLGANPDAYFDADTKKAIPEVGWLAGRMARLRGRKPALSPNSAPVLSLAITYGRQALIEKLLAQGADVNAPDDKGSTPLQYAVLHNQRDILLTLLDHRADVSHANSAGDTALHIAIAQANVVNAQLLLDRGANPNAANKAGHTPLDSLGDRAEDLHREWMLAYGDSKIPATNAQMPKDPPASVTKTYQRRLDNLRPLILALQRSGAVMSHDTQNRLAGSFDLNPREVEQALAATDTTTQRSGKTTHQRPAPSSGL